MSKVELKNKGNTEVISSDKLTTVKLHNTTVVSFDHKSIKLDSGGWKTVTTKARMNQASQEYNLGFTVSQKDNSWYVDFKGKKLGYQDGMVLRR